MLIPLSIVGCVAAGFLGWLIARMGAERRAADLRREFEVALADLRARLEATTANLRTREAELDEGRRRAEQQATVHAALAAEHARLETALAQERRATADKLQVLREAETALRDRFQALASDALRSSNETFLSLATARLEEAKTAAAAELASRQTAVEKLVGPIADALGRVEQEIRAAERHRVDESRSLLERIATLDVVSQRLGAETARLVDALKRPGVRGRWGELQLKRVVELAGMQSRCDFVEQSLLLDEERRMRPDLVVHLPGGKRIVVDAKVPLDAYLRALDAPDEPSRHMLLRDHARQVRTHLAQLAAKDYAASVQPGPEFVVMFLPGEVFFSAALEQDPELIEIAVAQHVIPASPTTLIALLRAVAAGWQQATLEQSAKRISELGRSLYQSLRVLAEHLSSVGARLRGSVEAYNQAIGSLEGNVLVKARRFRDLGAAAAEPLPEVAGVEVAPRSIVAPELTGGLPFELEPQGTHAGDADSAPPGDLPLHVPQLIADSSDRRND